MSNSSQSSSSLPFQNQINEVSGLSEHSGVDEPLQIKNANLANILDDDSTIKQYIPFIEHSEREFSLGQDPPSNNNFQYIQQAKIKLDRENSMQLQVCNQLKNERCNLQEYFLEPKPEKNFHYFSQQPLNSDKEQEQDQVNQQISRSSRSRRISRIGRGKIEKGRVDTKNIIKNFGRNTISFVEKRKYFFSIEFDKNDKKYLDFLPKMKKMRKKINTIQDLRDLWINQEYGKLMRKISEHYLRKQALTYIFNSNVKTAAFQTHIECRKKLQQALRSPHDFTNLR